LTESLVLGGLSCIFGILFGMVLNYLFTLTPMMGDYLAPVYTPKVFLQVLILALGLGALGGMYPAWRAANLQPIEALRYE